MQKKWGEVHGKNVNSSKLYNKHTGFSKCIYLRVIANYWKDLLIVMNFFGGV